MGSISDRANNGVETTDARKLVSRLLSVGLLPILLIAFIIVLGMEWVTDRLRRMID